MLTLQQLKDMPPRTIFATGIALDIPTGLFMARTGKELRWVAERGEIYDWTIYCHFAEHNKEWVRSYGYKVLSDEHIKKLVPCDKEAFEMYRF